MTVRAPTNLGPKPAGAALDVLQHEILQEKAATLGRMTQSMEAALAALAAFDEVHPLPDYSRTEERAALLDAAADALWWFVVQREACGLRNTEALLREYKVPAAVRLRMGVARRR